MSEVGDLLRDARLERRLSIDDVSRRTRIKPQFLEALENGDYHLLPGAAYISGFLRNYASAVGLHPDDVLQEYHAVRPSPTTTVKPATRVLANGHNREHRTKLFWALVSVFVLLGGGFAVKQYDATYAHTYSPPNITPPNLGDTTNSGVAPAVPAAHRVAATVIRVALKPSRPVWVKVTVDGRRAFVGILRPQATPSEWQGRTSIYVATMKGNRLRVLVNGKPKGPMSATRGLVVDEATTSGWQRVF